MATETIRIFLSSVTAEFRPFREALALALRRRGYEVKQQSEFNTGPGTLLEKLERYIRDECHAGIFLVGERYGSEPKSCESASQFEDGIERHSYTQWEYIFATRHSKARYVFIPANETVAPLDPKAKPESREQRALQHEFIEKMIRGADKDRTPFHSLEELKDHIYALNLDALAYARHHKISLDRSNPYVGFRRFEEWDKGKFYGRGKLVAELLAGIEAESLLLVTGHSGSGKSSVLRAGAVPEWRKQHENKCRVILFTPDDDPFEGLYVSLRSLYCECEAIKWVKDGHPEVFAELHRKNPAPQGEPTLIIIDQFEEIFTRVPEAGKERVNQFVASLVAAQRKAAPHMRIVLSMRDDFYGNLEHHRSLCEILDGQNRTRRVMRPTESELRAIIEAPAASHGVGFEADLVDRIVRETRGREGEKRRALLPLLQFTLEALWKEEVETKSIEDRVLNIDSYESVGGVSGALKQRIDKFYAGLNEEEQTAVQRIFLQLVQFGETDIPVSRRVNKEILDTDGSNRILDLLIRSEKLLISAAGEIDQGEKGPGIELAHEALIDGWDQYRDWIRQNQDAIRLHRRLEEDAAKYKWLKETDSEHAKHELWRGTTLYRAEEALKAGEFERIGGLSEHGDTFLRASREAIKDEIKRLKDLVERAEKGEAEAIRLEELATNNRDQALKQEALAIKQKNVADRSRKKARRFAIVAAVAALALLVALVWANLTRKKVVGLQVGKEVAKQQERDLNSVIKARSVNQLLDQGELDGPLRLASAEYERNPHLELRSAFARALLLGGSPHLLSTHPGRGVIATALEWNDGGSFLAVGYQDGTTRILDTDGREIAEYSQPHLDNESSSPSTVLALQWPSERDSVLVVNAAGAVTEHVPGSPYQSQRLRPPSGFYRSAAISPKGRSLALASASDPEVMIGSVDEEELKKFSLGRENFAATVNFTAPGDLIVGTESGQLMRLPLIEREERDALDVVAQLEAPVSRITAHPEDSKVAVVNTNGQVFSVETDGVDGVMPGILPMAPDLGRVLGLDWPNHANGGRLATVHAEGFLRLFDVNAKLTADRSIRRDWIVRAHERQALAVAWSPRGNRVATCDEEGLVRIWSPEPRDSFPFRRSAASPKPLRGLSISPNGRFIAAGCDDGTVIVRDADNLATLGVLPFPHGEPVEVNALAWHPSSRVLACADSTGTLMLTEWPEGIIITTTNRPEGHSREVWNLAWAPDGGRLYSASFDHDIRAWDEEGKPLIIFPDPHGDWAQALAVSPDGRYLLTTGTDGEIWKRILPGGEVVEKFSGHRESDNGGVGGLAFASNGELFASASNDGTVGIWDWGTGELLIALTASDGFREPSSYVESVAFSDDGKFMAAGGADGVLRVWIVDGNRLHLELPSNPAQEVSEEATSGHIWNVAWFPDSHVVVTSTADGTILFVDLDESGWHEARERLLGVSTAEIPREERAKKP